MVWLVTHMWLSLGLAAFFGILFGGALRGLLLKGKTRKAIVDRDVALVELAQSKLEIDQLYAAQSKLQQATEELPGEDLRAALDERETKLKDLSSKLSAAHGELDQLKKMAAAGAVAASGAAAVAMVSGEGKNADDGEGVANAPTTTDVDSDARLDAGVVAGDASLEWKNRYLTSRIRQLEFERPVTEDEPVAEDELNAAIARAEAAESALETFKSEMDAGKATSAAAAALVSGAAVAAVGRESPGGSGDTSEKYKWQTAYLRQRFSAAPLDGSTSDKGANDKTATVLENGGDAIAAPVLAEALEAKEVPDVGMNGIGDAEREIAAWRTTHLQQSLAYLEEHPQADRKALYGDASEEAIEVEAEPVASESTVESAGELEQELARLRWRNRYLEGRLAYVSGESPAADGLTDANPSLIEDVAVEEVPVDDKGLAEPTHADAFLATIDNAVSGETSVKPDTAGRPEDSTDDLSQIDGVDEDVADKLNELGIWHFHQIAGWTPENISWVNAELGLEGAIEAGDWVTQAGALSLGASLDPSV